MKIRRIAYHTPQIDVRGTCTALFDYAVIMREIYGIDAVIITRDYETCTDHDSIAIQKFSSVFNILRYQSSTLDNITDIVNRIDFLIQYSCSDMLYCIKYGTDDGIVSKIVPTSVHCVFDLSQPHGTVYAAVSKTLAEKYSYRSYVPHMVRIKSSNIIDNLRHKLDIPSNAIVIGRYGGMDTFDLKFVHDVIRAIVRSRNNIYFLFCNTPMIDSHPQIIYVDKITQDFQKSMFIQTCDAYIEGGSLGHTFGLAIAEFSVHNKPVIAYNSPSIWNRAHLDILGDRCLIYHHPSDLYNILQNFDADTYIDRDNNCYRDYCPGVVAKKFYDVFVLPCESV